MATYRIRGDPAAAFDIAIRLIQVYRRGKRYKDADVMRKQLRSAGFVLWYGRHGELFCGHPERGIHKWLDPTRRAIKDIEQEAEQSAKFARTHG